MSKGRIAMNIIRVIILSVIVSHLIARPLYAEVKNQPTAKISPTPVVMDKPVDEAISGTEENTPLQKVDYILPFPGILTDHPLYFLKYFRDRVMEMLITDPVKKLEFMILQSDKFMSMGQTYAGKSQWTKALDVFEKSRIYSERAFMVMADMKQNSILRSGDMEERLTRSTQKHQEILTEVRERINSESKSVIDRISKSLEQAMTNMGKK